MIDGSGLALQAGNGCCRASFKLVIVIAIEQVMLAVVLVLNNGFHLSEAGLKPFAIFIAGTAMAIGIASPFQIGGAKICLSVPDALIDQCLQASPIGSRL